MQGFIPLDVVEPRALDTGPAVGTESFKNTLFTETDLKVVFLIVDLGLMESILVGEMLPGLEVPALSVSVSFVPAYLLFIRPYTNRHISRLDPSW